MTNTTTTAQLYIDTHTALGDNRWSDARRLLEALARRSDNCGRLSAVTAYQTAPLAAHYAGLIQDRIDAVNASAD